MMVLFTSEYHMQLGLEWIFIVQLPKSFPDAYVDHIIFIPSSQIPENPTNPNARALPIPCTFAGGVPLKLRSNSAKAHALQPLKCSQLLG